MESEGGCSKERDYQILTILQDHEGTENVVGYITWREGSLME